jgi:hypothetical protein
MLRVVGVFPASIISTRLLRQDADGTYRQTAQFARILQSPATKIEMGQPSDVRPGAALEVRGVRKGQVMTIDAQRIVILTGYVKVVGN